MESLYQAQRWVSNLAHFLADYRWLVDSYVIEFFTEGHWEKLPASWRESLTGTDLMEVSRLLLNNPETGLSSYSKVYPLSLLAFVATTHTLSFPRTPRTTHPSSSFLTATSSSSSRVQTLDSLPDGTVCSRNDSDTNETNTQQPKEDGTTSKQPHSAIPFSENTPRASDVRKNTSEEDRATSQKPQGTKRAASSAQISGLHHIFRRHVKPKKQHEIKLLGEVVHRLSQLTKCRNIIDIGSGQGHLARYLAFCYGLAVTAVEAVGCHLSTAAKFDREVKKDIQKKSRLFADVQACSPPREHHGTIRHIETIIHPDITVSEFLEQLCLDPATDCKRSTEQDPPLSTSSSSAAVELQRGQEKYILVGLHTCGDLAPTMFRVYCQSSHVVGLVSVGCCYMKVTCTHAASSLGVAMEMRAEDSQQELSGSTGADNCFHTPEERSLKTPEMEVICEPAASCPLTVNPQSLPVTQRCIPETPSASITHTSGASVVGYPLSQFVRSLPDHSLSYEAREVACHAIETYRKRLRESSEHLKIHCHRAVVETIMRKHGIRRGQVRISKQVSRLPFEGYARALLQSTGIPADFDLQDLEPLLAQWEKVTVFFILRLLIAPCVENLVLLDRQLFLLEQGGYDADLIPLFDPLLSPRNLVIVAHK